MMNERHHGHEDHEHEGASALSGPALGTKALESLLVDKGLVNPQTLDTLIDTFETEVGSATALAWRLGLGAIRRTRLVCPAILVPRSANTASPFGQTGEQCEICPTVEPEHMYAVCAHHPWLVPAAGLPRLVSGPGFRGRIADG